VGDPRAEYREPKIIPPKNLREGPAFSRTLERQSTADVVKLILRAFSLAIFAILLSGDAFATNLITDPDFNTGSDWVFTNQPASGFGAVGSPSDPAGYVNCFQAPTTNCGLPNSASISQTIETNVGDNYDVSFWLAENDAASIDSGGYLSASFGGITGFMATDTTGIEYSWTTETFDVTATTTSSTFTLASQDIGGTFFLDDVSVTDLGPAATTPEPSSLVLLGSGLAGLIGLLRRKRNA